jgi:hypothetical protein
MGITRRRLRHRYDTRYVVERPAQDSLGLTAIGAIEAETMPGFLAIGVVHRVRGQRGFLGGGNRAVAGTTIATAAGVEAGSA